MLNKERIAKWTTYTLLTVALTAMFLIGSHSGINLDAQDSAETYEVDPVHSSVLFRVKHVDVAYFYGQFIEKSGTITYNSSDPSKSSINLTVNANSVATFSKKRDDHLRNQDFLNVKQFPNITFKSTGIKSTGENSYQVTGDFTLHGTTKEITTEVTKTGQGKGPNGNPRIGFETRFTIDRTEYGMKNMVGPVGAEVTIIISLEAIKK